MMFEYELVTAAAILGALFGAALVKGVTGLGFATSAIPMLALFLGVKAAIPLVLIPSLWSNVLLMRQAGELRQIGARFKWLYLGAVLGVVGGLLILAGLTSDTAEMVLGGVLILYCVYAWAQPHARLPQSAEKPLGPVVGLTTGAVNGMTGAQTIPLVPYLLSLDLTPNRVVQASNISFTVSSLVMLAGVGLAGWLTPSVLILSMLGLVPTYLGVTLGGRVRDRLAPDVFKRFVILVLGGSGLALIAKAIV